MCQLTTKKTQRNKQYKEKTTTNYLLKLKSPQDVWQNYSLQVTKDGTVVTKLWRSLFVFKTTERRRREEETAET